MTIGKRELDWTAAKERLQRATASLQESLVLPAGRTAEILRTRALALARPHAIEDLAPRLRVLVFTIGAESYAIGTTHVRGIARLTELTPLPGAPPYVVGVTSLRGEILPLFHLRQLLGRGSQALTDLSHVVLVGAEQLEFGLVVDQASEIVEIRLDEILPPSASLRGANREIVLGVTREAMTVLASEALCRDPRLFITTGHLREEPNHAE